MESKIYTILYFIVWLFVFLRYWRKNKKVGAYCVIVLSYVIYSFLSIFCYDLMPREFPHITLFPFVYLFTLLTVALSPIKKFDNSYIKSLTGVKTPLIHAVFFFFIVSTIVVLPSTVSHMQEGFTVLIGGDDGAKQLYDEMHANQQLHSNINGGIVGICKIIRYLLFEFSIFYFFYYLTLPHKNKILIAILLFSFIIDMVISLADGSRTASTMSAFTVLMTCLIFFRFYNNKIKRVIRLCGILIGGLFLFLTLAVTVGRTLTREGGATEGMIEYLGQGNLYFNEYAIESPVIRNGDRTCNIFNRLIGFSDTPESITKVRAKYPSMPLSDRNFSTFIGDFCLDFGPYITLFIIIIFSLWFTNITKIRGTTVRLEQLLIVQMAANICMHGGMYLFYYSFSGNYILIMYFLMYMTIKYNKGAHIIQIA